MNSSEHIDHNAEVNNGLLFPSLFKQAWATFKQKWCALYTLSLIPIIFLVAAYAIFISTIYIVTKLAGDSDFFFTIASVFHYAPNYVSAIGCMVATVSILGLIYFSVRSSIVSIKVLESESKMSVRHAWHGVSFKSILSLLCVAIIVGIIFVGGYVLLFIPLLFLATFYVNAIFANLVEGKKGIDALVVSRQYVKGYGAIVFVNLLVIMGVGLLVGLLFRLALGGAGLLFLAVYFGNISIAAAVTIALIVMIIELLILVLWKSFSLVILYSMYKKLQAMKSHHVHDLNQGRKTVKVWLVISIATIAIFVGVTTALNNGDSRRSRPITAEEARMMYQGNSNFMDYGGDTSYLEGSDGGY